MRLRVLGSWSGGVLVAVCLVAGCAPTRTDAPDPGAGRVTALVGEVVVLRPPEQRPQSLGLDSRVFPRDRVTTREDSRCQITLADGSVMTVGERSEVEIQEFRFSVAERVRSLLVRVGRGIMRLAASPATRATGPVTLSASLASVTFAGTEAIIEVTPSGTAVASLEGTVRVTSAQAGIPGEVQLGPGQGTDIVAGAAPRPAVTWGAARLERVKQATRVR